MRPKKKRMADCHPDRPHEAKGLCSQCYQREYHKKKHNNKPYRERRRKTQKRLRNNWRKYQLKSKYGLTIREYDIMLELQNNRCAICGALPKNGKSLHVDHDHKTREVRGLLCHSCNMMLGFAYDSTEILSKATEYLDNCRKGKFLLPQLGD